MVELKDDHHVRYHRVAERIGAAECALLGHLTGMNSDLGPPSRSQCRWDDAGDRRTGAICKKPLVLGMARRFTLAVA
jgi:hypothetical protein